MNKCTINLIKSLIKTDMQHLGNISKSTLAYMKKRKINLNEVLK